jgi:hypothetical protein
MKNHSPVVSLLVVWLSLSLVIPPELAAQAAQHAGQVSRVIPAVNIQRGTTQLAAMPQADVFWEDVVRAERLARARVTLDDGSVVNVGSESSLRITRHDASTRQTQLDLTYGRMRAKVVRLVQPGSSFEVRTPVAVAGVVGTDFFLLFENDILVLIVFEGTVRLCNLASQCVDVKAGETSSVRAGQPPDLPRVASPSEVAEAVQSTEVEEAAPVRPAAVARPKKRLRYALIAGVVVPAILSPVIGRLCARR